MRIMSVIGVVIFAIIAGCVSYPLLETTDDNTSGGSSGGASSGGSAGGSGGSSGGGGQAGPTQPDDNSETPDEPVLLAGQLDLIPCDEIVVVDLDAAGQPDLVFQISDGDISAWLTGDNLAFDEEAGELTNESRGETFAVGVLGVFDGTTRFVQRNDITLAVELQDGSLWLFSISGFSEVRQWLTGSDTISIVRNSATNGDGLLINHRRCTATAASEQ